MKYGKSHVCAVFILYSKTFIVYFKLKIDFRNTYQKLFCGNGFHVMTTFYSDLKKNLQANFESTRGFIAGTIVTYDLISSNI